MNSHFIKHFIRHYLTSKFIDVLHSPFVFELYQTCIKNNGSSQFSKIENHRKKLKSNTKTFFYTDFGASNKSREVKVSLLAKQHLKPARIAQILARITAKYPYQSIVELGTSLGITTSYLAYQSLPSAKIYTIEACEPVREIAKETFAELELEGKIKSYLGTFDEVLPGLLNEIGSLDFLFIDGNHSYEATLRYFNLCKPYLHNESVIVFDDIYWSPGMTQAWKEICADPSVRVSVDLFFIGLVYFRKEQVKEHFQLRIL
ncbi:MAG: SAM-dependent methyltransferase [Bacteroidetes bacterium B1(2017)]|nr:MAG: SAM-dependent methyltransferase [Bacteroidetes bacterium B1(2017)]